MTETEIEKKIGKWLNFTIYSTYALFFSFASYFVTGAIFTGAIFFSSLRNYQENHLKIISPFGFFSLASTIAILVGILRMGFLEKNLTNNESKIKIIKNKLPWNKKTTIFLEICGWLFVVQTIAGVVVAAKVSDDWKHPLYFSLEGFVGDKLSERLKQKCQHKQEVWEKKIIDYQEEIELEEFVIDGTEPEENRRKLISVNSANINSHNSLRYLRQ